MDTRLVTLSSILKWPLYFLEHKLKPSLPPEEDERLFEVRPEINDKVSLWTGDITHLAVDAIVNAANSELRAGSGVCGTIHRAAGLQLSEECQAIGGCPPGEARITGGYDLPAKHVIHVVGPQGEIPKTLRQTYQNSFEVMLQKGLRTIAFPCISTGVYGYPNQAAAHVALLYTRHFLEEHYDKIDRVIFTIFQEKDKLIYENLMQRYFPATDDMTSKL